MRDHGTARPDAQRATVLAGAARVAIFRSHRRRRPIVQVPPHPAPDAPILTLRPPRRLIAAAALAVGLAGCRTPVGGPGVVSRGGPDAGTLGESLSDRNLARFVAGMDPAMLALAQRHQPGRRVDSWGRPTGWASLDLRTPPDLGFGTATAEVAQQINALLPFSRLPIRPMRPFVLQADAADQGRALTCLSQAIYYEAAREPKVGQEAIAQVVLNRLRHPAYPKSVCGVVYQGAARPTGCQFTFTCDGSLAHPPAPSIWAQAEAVARQALGGFVLKEVGSATHYHAEYVAPYWAPTLVKMKQIGAHIFYRWTGPWGEPPAFTGRYLGGETNLSQDILGSIDARTQGLFSLEKQGAPPPRSVTLNVAGEVRTYTVADPEAAGGERTQAPGMLNPARRKPTPEEIRQINDALAAMEKPAPAAPAPHGPD
jgi:spore germination cell wall hydrolase CwlJ-like protein